MSVVPVQLRAGRRTTMFEMALLVCGLQSAIDGIVYAEWRRFRSRLGSLTQEQQLIILHSLRELANEILDPAIRRLQRAARQGQSEEVARS